MSRGSITTFILVMMVVFAVIFGAAVSYISRQAHETTLQEQEEQAFAAAEAGLHHVLGLLGAEGASVSFDDLHRNPPPSTVDHPIINSEGETVAQFTVAFLEPEEGQLPLRVIGRDSGVPTLCQTIEATIGRDEQAYRIVHWNHLPTVQCEIAPESPSTSLQPGGGPHPGLLEASDTPSRYLLGYADRYSFMGTAGQRVSIMVESHDFWPQVTLEDARGTQLAVAGYGAQARHVRYFAAVDQLRTSLATFAGQNVSNVEQCHDSLSRACIGERGSTERWFTLPADGLYEVEVAGGSQRTGRYQIMIEFAP